MERSDRDRDVFGTATSTALTTLKLDQDNHRRPLQSRRRSKLTVFWVCPHRIGQSFAVRSGPLANLFCFRPTLLRFDLAAVANESIENQFPRVGGKEENEISILHLWITVTVTTSRVMRRKRSPLSRQVKDTEYRVFTAKTTGAPMASSV
jgi:hypothetical protein